MSMSVIVNVSHEGVNELNIWVNNMLDPSAVYRIWGRFVPRKPPLALGG